MPDGNKSLEKAVAVEVFGINIECCAKLLGMTLESLAVRADVSYQILQGYMDGEGQLSDSRISAIAHVIGLADVVLTTDYGDAADTREFLRLALVDAKLIDDVPEEEAQDDAVDESGDETHQVAEAVLSIVTEEPAESHTQEEPPDNSAELQWDDDGLQVQLGTTVYDLKDKAQRARVMAHVRAAKGKRAYKELDQEAGLGKASSWWSSVEKGVSRIYRDDLEKIASTCEVSVQVLLTGNGLNVTKMPTRTRGGSSLVVIKRTIELPPLSAERRDTYFRDRVLNAKTEPAEGVTVGQLLLLAREQDGVDWQDAWLQLTKRGAGVQKLIVQWNSQLDALGQPIQVMIIESLCQRFLPDEK